jgi:hypothetical protein
MQVKGDAAQRNCYALLMGDELGILSLSGGDLASTTLGSWNLPPTSDTDIIPPISHWVLTAFTPQCHELNCSLIILAATPCHITRLFRRNFNLCE